MTPFAFWFMVIVFKTKKLNRAKEKRIQNLIKHGDKILIDLQNIKILNNSWNQEIVTKDKLDHVDINLNYFELQIPYKNDKIKYKIHIDMELDKLKTYLALKGKTFFYVDPNNINNRHLDLDFLDIK